MGFNYVNGKPVWVKEFITTNSFMDIEDLPPHWKSLVEVALQKVLRQHLSSQGVDVEAVDSEDLLVVADMCLCSLIMATVKFHNELLLDSLPDKEVADA